MKRNFLKNIISTVIISLFGACTVLGCVPTHYSYYSGELMTVEEVREKTQAAFWDEDGKLITGRWRWGLSPHHLNQDIRDTLLKIVDGTETIDSFDVQLINNINGVKQWYLVEFEPYGFFYGNLSKFVTYTFFCVASPFKLLDIDIENRYIAAPSAEGIQLAYFAAVIDGELRDIRGPAWEGITFEQGAVDKHMAYDFETHKWVEKKGL